MGKWETVLFVSSINFSCLQICWMNMTKLNTSPFYKGLLLFGQIPGIIYPTVTLETTQKNASNTVQQFIIVKGHSIQLWKAEE